MPTLCFISFELKARFKIALVVSHKSQFASIRRICRGLWTRKTSASINSRSVPGVPRMTLPRVIR